MLTKKQLNLLKYIDAHIKEHGVTPSYDEMKDAANLKSKSGVHRLVTALEERDFIRRLPYRARAIEVLKLPEAVKREQRARGEAVANVQGWDGSTGVDIEAADALDVPLMGRIAAGVPIEAISHPQRNVSVPAAMLTAQSPHYALEVQGDSMIEEGINDGDTVVIRRTGLADNGDIVVALVDDEEATLKRYRRKDGRIALEAANAAYEPQVYKEDQVRVQGRLVGLIRTY